MLSCIAGAGIVCVGLLQASSASAAYHRLEPSGLPGSSLLRLPPRAERFLPRILESARAHGRSFFTMPGLGSLYFWAEQAPPTCCIPGDWMTLLTEETQSRVVEDLRRTSDLCVIRWNPCGGLLDARPRYLQQQDRALPRGQLRNGRVLRELRHHGPARSGDPARGQALNMRRTFLICLALAALTLAALWPVVGNGFVNFDDPAYVYENGRVLAGLSWDNVKWAFSTGYFGNWHPLTWLSHMLDVQLFGLDAGLHHLHSLVLHTGSVLLLFLAPATDDQGRVA